MKTSFLFNNIFKRNEFLFPKFSFYDLFYNGYIERKSIYKFIKKNSHLVNGIFMDFGCGNKPYKSLFKVKKYIGIDIKKSGHNNINKKADIYYDGHIIPIKDHYFDCALATQCFEHIFNIDEIIKEISRVLKPGGIFITTLPLVWEEHEIPFDFFRYTEFGISNLLTKNNFDIVSIEKSNSYKNSIRQMNINYSLYKKRTHTTILNSILSLIIILYNNLLFMISKKQINDTPFSTAICVICKKYQ